MWQHVKLSDVSLGTRPRDSLVADEDVKLTNQPTKRLTTNMSRILCSALKERKGEKSAMHDAFSFIVLLLFTVPPLWHKSDMA